MAPARFIAAIMLALAGVALILATAGVYGVTSYETTPYAVL